MWGGYNPIDQRKKKVKRPDGTEFELGPTTTRPWKKNRGMELLTFEDADLTPRWLVEKVLVAGQS